MPYAHTQRAPLCLILYASAILCLALPWVLGKTHGIYVASAAGLIIAFLAAGFHHLAIEDMGTFLEIRFGPIPLFRRTVQYADIQSVELGRTSVIDGWGIHRSIRGGWVWNIWGRDCVAVRLKNHSFLRIGTDDPEHLAALLRTKTAP
jgi:hypothetical protein